VRQASLCELAAQCLRTALVLVAYGQLCCLIDAV
jgi:hypothetical protein